MGAAMKNVAAPEPVYRGLDRCDLCGILLELADRFAGLCARCQRTLSKPTKRLKRHERKPDQ